MTEIKLDQEEISKRIQKNNDDAKSVWEKIEKIIKGDNYNNGESLEHRLADIQMALDEYYQRTCEHCENADEKGNCKLDGLDCDCSCTYTSFFGRKSDESWHVANHVYSDKFSPYLTTDPRDPGILFTGRYGDCRIYLEKVKK